MYCTYIVYIDSNILDTGMQLLRQFWLKAISQEEACRCSMSHSIRIDRGMEASLGYLFDRPFNEARKRRIRTINGRLMYVEARGNEQPSSSASLFVNAYTAAEVL